MSAPLQIFIAYARKDASFLDELRTHFTPLERSGKVKIWYDGKIEPGAVWEQSIKENLHSADIILMLVSADAIASDYFYDKEMSDALSRHAEGTARVVPLILRPCAWQTTPISRLQALPKDGRPVTSWNDRDEAWNDAMMALWNMVEYIAVSKTPKAVIIEEKNLEKPLKHAVEKTVLRETKPEKVNVRPKELTRKSIPKTVNNSESISSIKKKEAEAIITEHQNPTHKSTFSSYFIDPFAELMVYIKGGTFKMHDRHDVTIKDFHLCKHPITQEQWRTIMNSSPSELINKECGLCPVDMVSWNDVQKFIKILNEKSGKNYRLPSEAEWEFAAKGGIKSKYYTGPDDINKVGWYNGNSKNRTQPVMQLKPNKLELYDLFGNVWEWCEDTWHDNLNKAPKSGKAWTSGGLSGMRVVRGGAYNSSDEECRHYRRHRFAAGLRLYPVGFRLAC